MTVNETREHLLDAAERLFGERGVENVSLRHITSAAGANVASINYHFGSKENLIRQVFRRRLDPINEERLRLLSAFEARSGRATIEQVMFAFVHPVIRRMSADPGTGSLIRLMSHVHSDVNATLAELVLREMDEMIRRFIEATTRALPPLPVDEIFWRAHFATGAMVHTAAASGLLQALSGNACRVTDPEELSYRLVAFTAAGFLADPLDARAAIGEIPEIEVTS